jgi:hypothetical protein
VPLKSARLQEQWLKLRAMTPGNEADWAKGQK